MLAIFIPPIDTIPLDGFSSLYKSFIRVDLPAPEDPTTKTNSQELISKSIFLKA
jgi:hypothetical protein